MIVSARSCRNNRAPAFHARVSRWIRKYRNHLIYSTEITPACKTGALFGVER